MTQFFATLPVLTKKLCERLPCSTDSQVALLSPPPCAAPPPPFPRQKRTRNVYYPIILRERSASTMCRFWRCAQARKVARLKRCSNVLATRVNPLVRGFLGRRRAGRAWEERRLKDHALVLVRD